jgi:hypothetical protein
MFKQTGMGSARTNAREYMLERVDGLEHFLFGLLSNIGGAHNAFSLQMNQGTFGLAE